MASMTEENECEVEMEDQRYEQGCNRGCNQGEKGDWMVFPLQGGCKCAEHLLSIMLCYELGMCKCIMHLLSHHAPTGA